MLKTELLSRPTHLKAQEFAEADSLALLKTELAEVDVAKETALIRKNLLTRHG